MIVTRGDKRFHRTRIISLSGDSHQSTGRYYAVAWHQKQINGAVSAYTEVKINNTSRSLELPETECRTVWIRLCRNRPQEWDNIDDPGFPFERNQYGHPLAWERRLEEVLLQEVWEKYPAENVSMFIEKLHPYYQCMPTTLEKLEEKPVEPICGENRRKKNLKEPTPLVDHVFLGCTPRRSATKQSDMKCKSDIFGKITTSDTEAKSNKKKQNRKAIYCNYDMPGRTMCKKNKK